MLRQELPDLGGQLRFPPTTKDRRKGGRYQTPPGPAARAAGGDQGRIREGRRGRREGRREEGRRIAPVGFQPNLLLSCSPDTREGKGSFAKVNGERLMIMLDLSSITTTLVPSSSSFILHSSFTIHQPCQRRAMPGSFDSAPPLRQKHVARDKKKRKGTRCYTAKHVRKVADLRTQRAAPSWS